MSSSVDPRASLPTRLRPSKPAQRPGVPWVPAREALQHDHLDHLSVDPRGKATSTTLSLRAEEGGACATPPSDPAATRTPCSR